MHVFDALAMLQLLILNIYARVMLDNIRSSYNFCSENGQNSPNFLLPNSYIFALNSPIFPTAKVYTYRSRKEGISVEISS